MARNKLLFKALGVFHIFGAFFSFIGNSVYAAEPNFGLKNFFFYLSKVTERDPALVNPGSEGLFLQVFGNFRSTKTSNKEISEESFPVAAGKV